MTKRELREVYLAKRKELTRDELEVRSKRICMNFFSSFDISSLKVIHSFLPIIKNNEPDTWLIIRQLEQHFPSVNISIPKVNSNKSELSHFYLHRDNLRENSWGILEPTDESTSTGVSEIDLVLVPLLTFDQAGNRVGYGKGFYDLFLSQCREDTKRVGISLFKEVEQIDDINSFDQRLHYCVTPFDVISF